jgi:hypothetical protein
MKIHKKIDILNEKGKVVRTYNLKEREKVVVREEIGRSYDVLEDILGLVNTVEVKEIKVLHYSKDNNLIDEFTAPVGSKVSITDIID